MSGRYFDKGGGGLDFSLCQIILQFLFLNRTYEVHCGEIRFVSYDFRSSPFTVQMAWFNISALYTNLYGNTNRTCM
jgi:hypothetical protein